RDAAAAGRCARPLDRLRAGAVTGVEVGDVPEVAVPVGEVEDGSACADGSAAEPLHLVTHRVRFARALRERSDLRFGESLELTGELGAYVAEAIESIVNGDGLGSEVGSEAFDD